MSLLSLNTSYSVQFTVYYKIQAFNRSCERSLTHSVVITEKTVGTSELPSIRTYPNSPNLSFDVRRFGTVRKERDLFVKENQTIVELNQLNLFQAELNEPLLSLIRDNVKLSKKSLVN